MSLQNIKITEAISSNEIKYKKNKARHGHGQDVKDIYNIRQVAGCLAVDPTENKILLISSRKNPGSWVIPKGGWEQDETQEHAALRETWEEAGVKGRIVRHLGVFVERSKKKGIKAHHWIFELEIEKVKKKYPERNKRERRWFTFDEALEATKDNLYIQNAITASSVNPLNASTRSPYLSTPTHSDSSNSSSPTSSPSHSPKISQKTTTNPPVDKLLENMSLSTSYHNNNVVQ
ncbi:hypothetical protein G6F46_003503 [Rhizopus delemar]|nr:hypothetical protein G6F54_007249 [Rhizopus delemar]KAG1509237.1 hypothetical protein G6F53_007601 [Rhizopus delemar]KAG1551518.1 hypothetical protein G6F49_008962 [Rhizopus delemar]KAG1582657.1 hypothetical protein G6F48_009015 [Rhizopus delemar]KAG1593203.1 hypothetical protein G6F47_009186 [Rhizopus delemar]